MPTLTPEQRTEAEAHLREVLAQDREQYERLKLDAQAIYRAVEGFHQVDGREGWAETCGEALDQYRAGRFLIERLGAQRLLDPKLMASLWGLRQGLLADLGTATTADRMLVDMAVLAYHKTLRVHGWIGSLALWIEHELFGQSAPAVKLRGKVGPAVEQFAVEDRLKKLGEVLLPVLDRANRMMVRNLKTMKELRQGPTPTVSVAAASPVDPAAPGRSSRGLSRPSRPPRRDRSAPCRMGVARNDLSPE